MEPLRARVLDGRLEFSVVERIRLVGYDDGGWVEKMLSHGGSFTLARLF
jgi:hypothetical protein